VKTFVRFIYALVLGSAFAFTLLVVSQHFKEAPEFCISCHLPNGKKLHSEKFKSFANGQPAMLAGLHKKKAQDKFSCSSCHSGRTLSIKTKIFVEEARNTLAYFFGKFEEPKKFDLTLMPDETCEDCHLKYKGGTASFHGMSAHIPKVKYACVACHKAHISGEVDFYLLNQTEVIQVCGKCHPKIPPSFRYNAKGVQ
jgi:predicted CXXCH cytochrome family protein